MELERKSWSADLKADDEDGDWTFSGHASTFNHVDSVGDAVMPGAFRANLPEFLQAGFIAWQHDWSEPIGKPIEAREDKIGLFVKGKISETAQGRDAYTLLKDDVIKKLSFGFRTEKAESWTEESLDEHLAATGQTLGKQAREIALFFGRKLFKLNLFEVSLVSVPANRNAVITAVKGLLDGPFAAASHSALAAVSEWADRLEAIAAMRKSDGRTLGPESRDRLAAMIKATERALDGLRALAVAARPTPSFSDIQSEIDRCVRLCADLRGYDSR